MQPNWLILDHSTDNSTDTFNLPMSTWGLTYERTDAVIKNTEHQFVERQQYHLESFIAEDRELASAHIFSTCIGLHFRNVKYHLSTNNKSTIEQPAIKLDVSAT